MNITYFLDRHDFGCQCSRHDKAFAFSAFTFTALTVLVGHDEWLAWLSVWSKVQMRMIQLLPLPPPHLLLHEIGLTFLVPAY